MTGLILAAGYATRLYPLTENFPKPLLTVGDRSILDWLLDDLDSTGCFDRYVVVSNHRYRDCFDEWASGRVRGSSEAFDEEKSSAGMNTSAISHSRRDCEADSCCAPSDAEAVSSYGNGKIIIVDDGTMTNETRLGAVNDIALAVRSLNLDEDLLIMAGDNLLDFSLESFIEFAREKQTSCVMRYEEADRQKLTKCGVMTLGESDRVLDMVEKPDNPPSAWCCPPFYYIVRRDLPLIRQALDEGIKADAPGSFIAWLTARVPVHAMLMPGRRYDVGNLASYEKIRDAAKEDNRRDTAQA